MAKVLQKAMFALLGCHQKSPIVLLRDTLGWLNISPEPLAAKRMGISEKTPFPKDPFPEPEFHAPLMQRFEGSLGRPTTLASKPMPHAAGRLLE